MSDLMTHAKIKIHQLKRPNVMTYFTTGMIMVVGTARIAQLAWPMTSMANPILFLAMMMNKRKNTNRAVMVIATII
jgi:hypothetical protein